MGYEIMAVRSDTLPPATHTNAVLVGTGPIWIVDPGSPDDDENARLAQHLTNEKVGGIILTHRHRDHTAGAMALSRALQCEIVAHPITKQELAGKVRVDRTIDEGDVLDLGEGHSTEVLFTPGHARGHIVLWDRLQRMLVLGDMIAGIGSVLISAPDGRVADYLSSLERLRALNPRALIPAHGPLIEPAVPKIEEYIAHRKKREADIAAVIAGLKGATLGEIADTVYASTPAFLRPWAMRAISAHLDKLIEEGRATLDRGAREDVSVYEEGACFKRVSD